MTLKFATPDLKLLERFDDQFAMPEGQSWSVLPIDESQSGVVDGEHVLARMAGPAFLVNGQSRNRRFYEKRLWERVIKDINERINVGGFIPCVFGHEQKIDEDAYAQGLISHVLTKMWIPENSPVGLAEILVLGTPSGQSLNHMTRGGMKIPVSTRGYGKVLRTNEGIAHIDPDTFYLESLDKVRVPGVACAYLALKESADTPPIEEDGPMTLERRDVQEMITEALRSSKDANASVELSEAQKSIKVLTDDKSKLVEAVNFYENKVGNAQALSLLFEGLRKWIEMPPFKGLTQQTGLLSQNSLADTPFQTAVSKLMGIVEKYVGFGTPDEVESMKAENAAYRDQVTTPDKLKEWVEMFKEYRAMGTPTQIKAYLATAKKVEEKMLEVQNAAKAKKFAEDLGVPEEQISVVEELIKHLPADKVEEMLKSAKETGMIEKLYKVEESKGGSDSGTKPVSKPADVLNLTKLSSRSMTSLLAEQMGEIENPQPVPTRA